MPCATSAQGYACDGFIFPIACPWELRLTLESNQNFKWRPFASVSPSAPHQWGGFKLTQWSLSVTSANARMLYLSDRNHAIKLTWVFNALSSSD